MIHNKILSNREIECITLASQGQTVSEISSTLNLKITTIKHYQKNIRLKLNTKNMAQTIYKAVKFNLIKMED